MHDPAATLTVLATPWVVRLNANWSPAVMPAPATLHNWSEPLCAIADAPEAPAHDVARSERLSDGVFAIAGTPRRHAHAAEHRS